MRILQLVLVVVFLGATSSSLSARTWYVTPDGTGDVPNIQAGIDAAVDGDIVLLANGTYTGDGNRDIDYHGKAITVRSENGNPKLCVIDCEGSESDPHRGFYLHSDEESSSVLEGISVTNGFAPSEIHRDALGDSKSVIDAFEWFRNRDLSALDALGGPSIQLRWLSKIRKGLGNHVPGWVRATTEGWGGGAYLYYTSATVSNCIFTNNAGTGVGVDGEEAMPTFRNCIFTNNIGSGVAVGTPWAYSNAAVFVDCEFTDNLGDGVFGAFPTLDFLRCTFSRNDGCGVRFYEGAADADSCVFSHNLGSGLKVRLYSEYDLKDCTLSNNSGPGISMDESRGEITDCELARNTRGIWCRESRLKAAGCVLSGNGEKGRDGGGVYLWSSYMEINDCRVSDNIGAKGGGIALECDRDVRIDRCTFVGNSADKGGAFYCEGFCGDLTVANFTNCTIYRNSATVGGALHCTDVSLMMSGCTVAHNSADKGAAVYLDGRTRASFENTVIAFNGLGETFLCEETLVQPPDFACCDIYGNFDGDSVCADPGQFPLGRNISVDPLFCDAKDGDYSVRFDSPCLPDNNLCQTLIGAWGLGCSAIAGRLNIIPGLLNVKSRGVVPIVFDGAENFDVSEVHVSSVTLEGARTLGKGTSPHPGALKLKFATQDIVKNLGQVTNRETRTLKLTGYLLDGTPFEASDSVMILFGGPDGLAKASETQSGFYGVTPNPFNPTTRITYVVTTQGHVRVSVYDVAGRLVDRLVNEAKPAGEHVVEWNAQGRPSGIYFCRLETGGMVRTHKLVFLK